MPVKGLLPLPETLQGVFFDFPWDTRKAWLLSTKSTVVPFKDLTWLLELPVWTTVPGEARFDLAPRTVLEQPERFPARWSRILMVDLKYSLEMFHNDSGLWVILDGYHRLARHQVEGSREVAVRLHPDHLKAQILRDS